MTGSYIVNTAHQICLNGPNFKIWKLIRFLAREPSLQTVGSKEPTLDSLERNGSTICTGYDPVQHQIASAPNTEKSPKPFFPRAGFMIHPNISTHSVGFFYQLLSLIPLLWRRHQSRCRNPCGGTRSLASSKSSIALRSLAISRTTLLVSLSLPDPPYRPHAHSHVRIIQVLLSSVSCLPW